MWETWDQYLGQEDPLEKEMATHSSILAWRIPWTEEHGGLQTMESQRVGLDWATSLSLFTPSISHWTWAAAGRGMVFSSKAIPKGMVAGGCCWLHSHSRDKSFIWIDCTVLLFIHSSLPLSLTSPLFIHLMGEFPPDSTVFFLLGKTYKKVVTEMNYNLLPSAYSWSQGWKWSVPSATFCWR